MKNILILGNWKMHGSLSANQTFFDDIKNVSIPSNVNAGICAPFPYLAQLQTTLTDSGLRYGAQDISIHDKGAYTGEVSASMLADFACSYVIVGHSERRQYHQETNELIAQKACAALAQNITPVICVGETLQQRENNETLAIIEKQIAIIFNHIPSEQHAHCVLAYEPVWAIGTGLTATPTQAQEVHAFIRAQLSEHAKAIAILYGGSVNADNAVALFSEHDIDGGLVGGASLKAESFIALMQSSAAV